MAIDNNKNIHAMNFYINDKKLVYYLMSGFGQNYRNSGVQNLIHWKAIEYHLL